MNPIINPLWFYLIGMSNSLIILSAFIGSCALIVAIILGVIGGMEWNIPMETKMQVSKCLNI